MQANIRHCLCLVLSNLFGATSGPLFVVASAGLKCAWEGPNCVPRLAFISTGSEGRSIKVLKHPNVIFLHLPHPAGCLLVLATETVSGSGGVIQASRKVFGVVPAPETHYLVCLRFFPDLAMAATLGVRGLQGLEIGSAGRWKVFLLDLSCWGSASKVHGKV